MTDKLDKKNLKVVKWMKNKIVIKKKQFYEKFYEEEQF